MLPSVKILGKTGYKKQNSVPCRQKLYIWEKMK